jgi:CRISPR system Cascade subunit CasE
MFLHRLYLNVRCREARRDLADPYQLHSTLCRAFTVPDHPCPENAFLWRLESERDGEGNPRLLVQSRDLPTWDQIEPKAWFARTPDPALNLVDRLDLDALKAGMRFRFRLRANPCMTRDGKRVGLRRTGDQEAWLARMGQELHGFKLPRLAGFDFEDSAVGQLDLRITQPEVLQGRPRNGNPISVFSVLFEGRLTVDDPCRFRNALLSGIGHGKVLGLGLLSVVATP